MRAVTERHGRGEREAALDVVVLAHERLDRAPEVGALDAGQEADAAEVDAEDRDFPAR